MAAKDDDIPDDIPPAPPKATPRGRPALPEVPAPTSALVAPVDDGVAEAGAETDAEPGELAPQTATKRAAPVTRTAPTRTLRPGDLVCGECGEGNLPSRKFCSRCGNSLASAATVKAPWWRRLLTLRRGPKVVKAGKRPKAPGQRKDRKVLRTVLRRIRAVVLVLVVLGAIGYSVYAPFRNYVNDRVSSVKENVFGFVDSTLSPVRARTTKANLETKDHPATAAVDLVKNSYWAAPWLAEKQPILTVDFGENVVIKKMIFTSGAYDEFAKYHRPSLLQLTYSNEKTETVTLEDKPDPQEITLSAAIAVSSVKIQIVSVYPAQKGTAVATTEIELFGAG